MRRPSRIDDMDVVRRIWDEIVVKTRWVDCGVEKVSVDAGAAVRENAVLVNAFASEGASYHA